MRPSHIHGMAHLQRVEQNGLRLATSYPDAHLNVIRAFAYLHDSCRQSDNYDPEHGPRAARLVPQIRHTLLSALGDEEIDELIMACEGHTKLHRTGIITVDICFDADRLDLGRVGITPDPSRMATTAGARLASQLTAP